MWIVNAEDLDSLEARIRVLLRAECVDVGALRTAEYVRFRQRVLRFLGGYDCVRTGEAIRCGSGIVVLVLGAYEGVVEAEVLSDVVSVELDPCACIPNQSAKKTKKTITSEPVRV